MERPLTMKSGKSGKSGVALKSHYSVHHRSDILIEEQVSYIKCSDFWHTFPYLLKFKEFFNKRHRISRQHSCFRFSLWRQDKRTWRKPCLILRQQKMRKRLTNVAWMYKRQRKNLRKPSWCCRYCFCQTRIEYYNIDHLCSSYYIFRC